MSVICSDNQSLQMLNMLLSSFSESDTGSSGFSVFAVVDNLFSSRIVTVHISAYKLFQVNTYRQQLRERCRRKQIGKGFSIMHNATTFGWKAYRAMWKKRTREERSVI